MYFRRLQTIFCFFFCKSNIWGEVVAYICLQRGGRSWGEMSTLSLWINPLGRSSKEHLHVSTSRVDKGGWSLTVRVACSRAAAEVSLVLTLSLVGVHVSRTSSSSHSGFWASALWCAALCSANPNRTVWLMRLHAMVDVNTIYTALIQPPPGAGLLEHVSDNQPERQTGAQPSRIWTMPARCDTLWTCSLISRKLGGVIVSYSG